MIEWCAIFSNGKTTALYSRDLHGCDYAEGALRLTLLRSVPYADHHPFSRNEETGYQGMGLQFREAWLLEAADIPPEHLPQMARTRLENVECAETTGHAVCGSCPPFSPPVVDGSKDIVVESARKREDGIWELHLLNYGEEQPVTISGEKSYLVPSKSLTILTVPDTTEP